MTVTPDSPKAADPLADGLRWSARAGTVVFAALFTVRAFDPLDPILVTIALALVGVSAAVLAGQRWAGWAYLLFPTAVFATPALRELSFNLSAIDSGAWRWHALASLVSLGLATGAAVAAGVGDRAGRRLLGGLAVGGLALGLGFVAVTPVLADEPGFGRGLTDDQLASLPVIDLLDFRYDPGVVTVPASGIQRFRLDNPSDVPHTVTIDELDLEVWVPGGRWAVLEFDAGTLARSVAFYCSVGDHRDLGMTGLLEVG